MLELTVDRYPFLGAAPTVSDALAAAAFIFNNRNAQVADAETTTALRGKSISEQDIAAGFATADSATLDTVWLSAPDTDALGFAMATIENNLRLGLPVPVIITLLRAKRVTDARLTEPLIAESFRRVQIKRLPPSSVPPSTSPPSDTAPGSSEGLSKVAIVSLALGGIAASAGAVLYMRRRRRAAMGFGGLGSPASSALAAEVDDAYQQAEANVEAVTGRLRDVLSASFRRLRQTEAGLDALRRRIEKAADADRDRAETRAAAESSDDHSVDEEQYVDRDLQRLRNELEDDGTGLNVADSEFAGHLMEGARELKKTRTALERRRRQLVKIGAR